VKCTTSSEISARTTGLRDAISYAYDEAGNRLEKTAGSTTSYSYDCMNRLTSATGMGFDWDENGNLVYMHDGSDAWNYTHDPEGRLLFVRKNGALQSWFWYDADGRRVKIVDGQEGSLFHVYSGLDVVYEEEGATTTKHYYANGLHIAENRGGTVEYFHQDHLGSTKLKTDSSRGFDYEHAKEKFTIRFHGAYLFTPSMFSIGGVL